MHNSYHAREHDSLSSPNGGGWMDTYSYMCVARANLLVHLSDFVPVCFENVLFDVCVHADWVNKPVY
jgi:hypothetical protein